MVDEPRPEDGEYPLIFERLPLSDLAWIDVPAIRLFVASMLETNDEWAVARRHMSLEALACVTDNPTVRLPAVAALSGSDLSDGRFSNTTPSGTIFSDLGARIQN